jgi:hypothetical protein
MHGCWHDFEASRERQRDILREAEALRLARTVRVHGGRPRWSSGPLGVIGAKIRAYLRRLAPSGNALPPDNQTAVSGADNGSAGAVFEEGVYSLRPSSVIELRREAEGYVVHEVDLLTGDDVLYLSTEEPEWAAWIWTQKTRR